MSLTFSEIYLGKFIRDKLDYSLDPVAYFRDRKILGHKSKTMMNVKLSSLIGYGNLDNKEWYFD